MHKKTDTYDLNMPKDDIDCWERYPKHRWVYDLSRLLDAQQIGWSPYKVSMYPLVDSNFNFESKQPVSFMPGIIYSKAPEGEHIISEVYIVKGEIKLIRHIDRLGQELPNLVGEIELRLSAFVALHFVKFTGVITCETYGNEIRKIQLRAYSDLSLTTNADIIKLARRIYKRIDSSMNGLTDQLLRETLAS